MYRCTVRPDGEIPPVPSPSIEPSTGRRTDRNTNDPPEPNVALPLITVFSEAVATSSAVCANAATANSASKLILNIVTPDNARLQHSNRPQSSRPVHRTHRYNHLPVNRPRRRPPPRGQRQQNCNTNRNRQRHPY